jgi:hypothetical protein
MDLFGRAINFKHKERYGFYDKNKEMHLISEFEIQ